MVTVRGDVLGNVPQLRSRVIIVSAWQHSITKGKTVVILWWEFQTRPPVSCGFAIYTARNTANLIVPMKPDQTPTAYLLIVTITNRQTISLCLSCRPIGHLSCFVCLIKQIMTISESYITVNGSPTASRSYRSLKLYYRNP